jgi:aldehyde dehydrogenase (NAD+)
MSRDLVEAIPPELARTPADTRGAEILPLLAACKFLEANAAAILKPKPLGSRGLPLWLFGVRSEIQRVPLGRVLLIGPANYPLFLPGVQALQALCAGNAVVWKPGRGGQPVAEVFAAALEHAGLPYCLLRVTDDSIAAATAELTRHPAKVFFTGSAAAGREVLHACAETATPVVTELSGCDAVIVLPSADPVRVADALGFGMRLNGSATCMAPRRLVLVGSGHEGLIATLRKRFAAMPGVVLPERIREQVVALAQDAESRGAKVCGDTRAIWFKPLLILDGRPEMESARADVFAPILTVLEAPDAEAALGIEAACPFGLTVAIFGEERQALALGARMSVGTVFVNDLIVPTADPRVPFAGRRGSGFGATRGAEGLLEMTAIKTVQVRRGKSRWHYQETSPTHANLFDGMVEASHGATGRERWHGLRRIVQAGRKLGR